MTMYFTKDARFGIDTCMAGSVGSAHRSAGHGDMDVNDLDEVLGVESFSLSYWALNAYFFYWLRDSRVLDLQGRHELCSVFSNRPIWIGIPA